MKAVTYFILAAASIGIIMLLLHEIGLLSWISIVLALSVVVVFIVISTILIISLLVAIPYYLLKKKPETDEYGNYLLKDFKE
ncbi:MAG: hypothetical protein ACQEQM_05965 [Thermoplasmatota archaeon]